MWVRNLSGWCLRFLKKLDYWLEAQSLWRPHVHHMSKCLRLFHQRLICLTICILWNYQFPLTGLNWCCYIYFFINAKKKDMIINQPTYSYSSSCEQPQQVCGGWTVCGAVRREMKRFEGRPSFLQRSKTKNARSSTVKGVVCLNLTLLLLACQAS